MLCYRHVLTSLPFFPDPPVLALLQRTTTTHHQPRDTSPAAVPQPAPSIASPDVDPRRDPWHSPGAPAPP